MADPLQDLSAAISAALGTPVTVTSIGPVGAGANNGTHLKLTTAEGKTLGLKVSSRGVANGTTHEYLTGLIARSLGFPGAGRCSLIKVPVSVPTLGGKDAVVIEWLPNSVALAGAGNATAARQSAATARQLAEWMWLAIALGVGDRHLGNFVWSEQEAKVAMIDFEEWSPGSQTAVQLRGTVEHILAGSVAEPTATEMLNGIFQARDRWTTQKAAIEPEFAHLGEAMPALLDTLDCLETARNLTGVIQLVLPTPNAGPQVPAGP